jgi:uncharacterized membrane protein YgcG
MILRFWLPGIICFLISGLAAGRLIWATTTLATGLLGAFVSALASFLLPEAILSGGGSSSSGGSGRSSGGGSGGGGSSGGGGASGGW